MFQAMAQLYIQKLLLHLTNAQGRGHQPHGMNAYNFGAPEPLRETRLLHLQKTQDMTQDCLPLFQFFAQVQALTRKASIRFS